MPRDPDACELAAQMKRRHYTYPQIAAELVRRFDHIPHLTRQGAVGYVTEGIQAENRAIAEEIANDPYSSPVRDYILDRIRARIRQAETLAEVEQEAWTLIQAHPDKTIEDISPTLKWVVEARHKLFFEGEAASLSQPAAPDPDMQRRFSAADTDPGV